MPSPDGVVNNTLAVTQPHSSAHHPLLPKPPPPPQQQPTSGTTNSTMKSATMLRASKGKISIGLTKVLFDFGITQWDQDEAVWGKMMATALQKASQGLFAECDSFPDDPTKLTEDQQGTRARLVKNLLLVNWISVQCFLYGHSIDHNNNNHNTYVMEAHRQVQLYQLLTVVSSAQIFGALKVIAESPIQRQIQQNQVNTFLREQLALAKEGRITLKAAKGLLQWKLHWIEDEPSWRNRYSLALQKYAAEYQRIVNRTATPTGAFDDPALGQWMSVNTLLGRQHRLSPDRARSITELVVRFKELHHHKLQQAAVVSLLSVQHRFPDPTHGPHHHFPSGNHHPSTDRKDPFAMLPSNAAILSGNTMPSNVSWSVEHDATKLLDEMIGIGSVGRADDDIHESVGRCSINGHDTHSNAHRHPGAPSAKRWRDHHHLAKRVTFQSLAACRSDPHPSGPAVSSQAPPSSTVGAAQGVSKNAHQNLNQAVVTPPKSKAVSTKPKRPVKTKLTSTQKKKRRRVTTTSRSNVLAETGGSDSDDEEVGVLVLDNYFDWEH